MFTLTSPFHKTDATQTGLSALLFVLMAATILTALGFQYIGGFLPCKLCLEERIPYYIGTPLLALCFMLSYMRGPGALIRIIFIIVFVLTFYNFALSVYHAGAEYKFWQGPSDCSSTQLSIGSDASTLLSRLNATRPVSCSDAAFQIFGISMAGMNAIASLFFAFFAFLGAFARKK